MGRMSDLPTSERFPMQLHHTSLFGAIDDGVYCHQEALQAAAAADPMSKLSSSPSSIMKHDSGYGGGGGSIGAGGGGGIYGDLGPQVSRTHMAPLHGAFGESMIDGGVGMSDLGCGASAAAPQSMYPPVYASHQRGPPVSVQGHHVGPYGAVVQGTNLHCGGGGGGVQQSHPLHSVVGHSLHLSSAEHHLAPDCDTRELEGFAEHFKQRRIKIGVTQADVGSALGKLKIPGVGSLSQSTICRFESLTLSHNNMVALKPVLQAWLEEAEKSAMENRLRNELFNGTGPGDKKRKRTSIAAPEKRSLEAYFAIQPRPSGEKIAQIADKLDLKKNVVRVWFCNQRQKQKRMKFSAASLQGPH